MEQVCMNRTNLVIAVLLVAVLGASVLLVDTLYKKVSKNGESLFASVTGSRDQEKDKDRPLTKAEIEVMEALRNTNNPQAASRPETSSAPQPPQNTAAPEPSPQKKEAKPLRDIRDIQVTMYVTSWCPYCNKARDYLNSQGVNFREYDIERDASAAQEMRTKTGGSRGVPVIDIEGTILRGFSPQAITNAINQKRRA
jgi:mycoredoxin